MSGWTAKRFWKAATVEAQDNGFTVRLDGRPVKTPAKTPLILPTRAMAEAVAAEWEAQTGVVKPATMPVTRAANSAIDKIAVQFDEVAGLLAAYGGSDLLCYRATGPAPLVARQEAAWDPLLQWAEESLGAPLHSTRGVVHVDQPEGSLNRLSARVFALSPFQLAALHDLIAISGSLVLALAIIDGRLGLDEAWEISRVDESWQNEQWGEDEDAAAQEALRKRGFDEAGRFFALCG
jgi:chaperone required for assembly of F1-ATPase